MIHKKTVLVHFLRIFFARSYYTGHYLDRELKKLIKRDISPIILSSFTFIKIALPVITCFDFSL